jgi:asparagine synthase (glutamine-hydrolysing)
VSGLCGWVHEEAPGPGGHALIERMAANIRRKPGDAAHTHVEGGVGIAVIGDPREIDLAVDHDIVAAVAGRPVWRAEYAALAQRDGSAMALAEAFRRRGHDLFEVLGGHFVIFAAEPASGRAVAAIDRMGVGRLCYRAGETGPLVFGSTTDSVRAFAGTDISLNPQALYDYLYFSKPPAPETIFRGIRKLMAAEALRRERDRTTNAFYWRMPFDTVDRRPPSTLKRELVETIRRAVERTVADTDMASTGAFLSGGLDSSTVTGMLARTGREPVNAFSIGFDEAKFDERHFARVTAKHFGVRHFEYVVTPKDFAELTPLMAAAYDEPFSNTSAILVYCCARLAREHGVTLMIAGDGGDEIFGGNSRYVQQSYLDLYSRVPLWFRRGAFEPALRAMPFGDSIGLLRKARSYVEKASIPLPERFQVFNAYADFPISRAMAPPLAAEMDDRHTAKVMHLSYDRVATESSLQRMFALDIQLTLADDDIRKVSTMCEAAGVSVRYPMLDDEVTTFAAHIPAHLLMSRHRLRHFYKEAFRGFLADETLTKPKHGFGMPFEHWVAGDGTMRQMVGDSLLRLKRRKLYADKFIDDVLDGSADDVEALRLDAQWSLMMLELWLERHVSTGAF